jgi:hypothetical protein
LYVFISNFSHANTTKLFLFLPKQLTSTSQSITIVNITQPSKKFNAIISCIRFHSSLCSAVPFRMKRTASDISHYVMSSSSLQSRQDSAADFNLISRNAVKFKAAQVYLPKDVNGPSFYASTQSEAKVESYKSTQKSKFSFVSISF